MQIAMRASPSSPGIWIKTDPYHPEKSLTPTVNEISNAAKGKSSRPPCTRPAFLHRKPHPRNKKSAKSFGDNIDIAIVLKDNVEHTFDTDEQLMLTRKGEETIIEPHAFTKDEFNNNTPTVFQIIKHGIRIEL